MQFPDQAIGRIWPARMATPDYAPYTPRPAEVLSPDHDLFGLAILVPIIEEFFLRVFLVRFVMHVDWFKIPFGKVDRLGLITSIAFPILMHPAEIFAAAVWFGMITWLMLRTRNIWDCVAAHAVTNALLGAYVIYFNDWQFM